MEIAAKRSEYFDVLRGFGIICVVLGHVLNEEFGNFETEVIRKYIYIYHLPLFFFISGYFIKKEPLLIFLKKKVKTLYLPCVAISTFSLLIVPIWTKFGVLKLPDIYVLIHKIFKIICFKADGYYVGACWFFSLLFFSVILFELVLQVDSYICVCVASLIEGVIGIICINKKVLSIQNINISLAMQPFLLTGYTVKKNKYKLKENNLVIGISCVLIILGLNAITGYEVELSKGKVYGNGALFYPVVFLGIYFSCVCAKWLNTQKCQRMVAYIGKHSNTIMMLHFIAFKIVDIILSFFMSGDIENTILGFPRFRLLYFIMGIAIPLALDNCLRFFLKLAKNGWYKIKWEIIDKNC